MHLHAARALARIAIPRAIDPLRQLLDDKDKEVKDAAAYALEAIKRK